jgi:nitrogen regulatory protein PII
MQKIETIVDMNSVTAVEGRLRALGIKRITALEVSDLGDDTTARRRVVYRGVAGLAPTRKVQLQILADDFAAQSVVDALRALGRTGQVTTDTILVYSVGMPTALSLLDPPSTGASASLTT